MSLLTEILNKIFPVDLDELFSCYSGKEYLNLLRITNNAFYFNVVI